MLAAAATRKVPIPTFTLTPAMIASVHSRLCIYELARCAATSEEEHAVSTHAEGPRMPKVYERRPHSTLKAEATAEYGPGAGEYARHKSLYCDTHAPTA